VKHYYPSLGAGNRKEQHDGAPRSWAKWALKMFSKYGELGQDIETVFGPSAHAVPPVQNVP
jgi:hypothetical protein